MLFREKPLPAKPNETLGERAARQANQRVPPPPGRGLAMLVLGLLALGGVLYSVLTGGGSVTKTMRAAHDKVEQDKQRDEAAKAVGQPRADGPAPERPPRQFEITVPPAAAPGPDTAASAEPGSPTATTEPAEAAPEIPLSDFAAAVRAAPPEMRPAIR